MSPLKSAWGDGVGRAHEARTQHGRALAAWMIELAMGSCLRLLETLQEAATADLGLGCAAQAWLLKRLHTEKSPTEKSQ